MNFSISAIWVTAETGAKTTDGLKRISDANLKHGQYTKDKLEAQRYAAKVGRRILGELKQIELKLLK